jgi:serine/threonine-protein kinase RsbW
MEVKVALALPRDEISIPVVRRICARALEVLGVRATCIEDVEVALAEACANVLRHAHDDDEYEVSAGIDGSTAVIEVLDAGGGFDAAGAVEASGEGFGDLTSERGRGIMIMRALMDDVHFITVNGGRRGTRVHLEKQLEWEPGSPIERLSRTPIHRGVWREH